MQKYHKKVFMLVFCNGLMAPNWRISATVHLNEPTCTDLNYSSGWKKAFI